MKRVYLDYAASTPVDRQVEAAMRPYFGSIFGNPNSLHQFGQEASRAVFKARCEIAEALGADYQEIIFTGSATDANNLAIRGIVQESQNQNPRVIVSAIEHESVLEICRNLEKEGVEVIYIPVSRSGFVDFNKLKAAINANTVLVSVMHTNNEVGTIQPIEQIAAFIKKARKPGSVYPLLHTDAVQSFQYLDCNVNKLGVDLLTLSAHKIYGPKGIGVLYIRGLDQKRKNQLGWHFGTDNVPYIVGFAKAVAITEKIKEKESARVAKLRDYFWARLKKKMPKLEMNGSLENRLPNNLNIYFPDREAHDLLIKLDMAGIASSPGAACLTRVAKSSYVLEEMGFSPERSGGSLRFSLGRQTSKAEIDYAVKLILDILAKQ